MSVYNQPCTGAPVPGYCGSATCRSIPLRFCIRATECTGTCDCEDLSGVHLIEESNTCSCTDRCGWYPWDSCPDGTSCDCNGNCYYVCEDGWEWDPILEECVEAPTGFKHSRGYLIGGV